jgi:hypothetical protein
MTTPKRIRIRRRTERDAEAIERLAQLEGVGTPDGDLLVAEVDGAVWAAVELGCGAVIADPFRPSGDVAELLRVRFERLNGRGRRRRGLGRWLVRGDAIPCRI